MPEFFVGCNRRHFLRARHTNENSIATSFLKNQIFHLANKQLVGPIIASSSVLIADYYVLSRLFLLRLDFLCIITLEFTTYRVVQTG